MSSQPNQNVSNILWVGQSQYGNPRYKGIRNNHFRSSAKSYYNCKRPKTCYNCGSYIHLICTCPKRPNVTNAIAKILKKQNPHEILYELSHQIDKCLENHQIQFRESELPPENSFDIQIITDSNSDSFSSGDDEVQNEFHLEQ